MKKIKKICFVVHRYAPYPGGSEYNVQRMAEECHLRGIDVTVFTGCHKGNLNGIRVTDDLRIFDSGFDLIIVHGGDVYIQNFILKNANKIDSPILYLLIKPSTSNTCLQALIDAAFIGCCTREDFEHVIKFNVPTEKIIEYDYGLKFEDNIGIKGIFKYKYGIDSDKKMFLSCGGFWQHKGFDELIKAFNEANIDNSVLVLTGYDQFERMPSNTNNVICLKIDDPTEIKNAMADAYCYIMNSYDEGYGLVIIESMLNKTPWIARKIAAAELYKDYGITYTNYEQLVKELVNFVPNNDILDKGYEIVLKRNSIEKTIDDLLKVEQFL